MIIKINKPVTKAKLEEAQEALRKKNKAKGFDAKKFSGKLKDVFGDPLEYQKKVRNEWK